MARPVLLTILDGWGLAEEGAGNAAYLADTPTLDALFAHPKHHHATLQASGEAVGLPVGQQGNSEVGHLNLGAGRVVYQDLLRIDRDVASGFFAEQPLMVEMLEAAEGKQLHLLGLLSDGGVHSHQEHLYALLAAAKAKGLKEVYVHACLDGRDVLPDSAGNYLAQLEAKMQELGIGQIATICGRYWTMDRDQRWERVEKAWRALVRGQGVEATSPQEAIEKSYAAGVFDEFVEPTVLLNASGAPRAQISGEDVVCFFNFRADRAREISHALADPSFAAFDRSDSKCPLLYTMTEYEAGMEAFSTAIYPPLFLKNTLGEWLALHGKSQLRIAETEKYAHVTFFFNGGVEAPNPGEERELIPSPKVATYDLQPEMSADAVADGVVAGLQKGYDFILLNFANPDMVGHTGMLDAAQKALTAVDQAIAKILPALQTADGILLLTADHGNCERMLDEQGHPVTSHTTNLVPILLAGVDRTLKDGALCDVAPTVCELMELDIPEEMTGHSLLVK